MKQIALITGATSGIGEATAVLLSKHNYNIIVTGRRQEKLLLLK
jgi:3-hydroxy acid dehydrogenase / malonic semialdehyde reductase